MSTNLNAAVKRVYFITQHLNRMGKDPNHDKKRFWDLLDNLLDFKLAGNRKYGCLFRVSYKLYCKERRKAV